MPHPRSLLKGKIWISTLLFALFCAAANPGLAADREIYPAPEQAQSDLAAGLKTAAATHKNVIIDFGGNWCGDCHVLDIYFHDPANQPLLESNYVLVHVNVGHLDQNQGKSAQSLPGFHWPRVARRSQCSTTTASSSTASLNWRIRGRQCAEMESSAVTSFLLQWKPARHGM